MKRKITISIFSIFLFFVVFAIIFSLLYTPVIVVGDSMDPTLANYDYAYADTHLFKLFGLNRFDIIVFEQDLPTGKSSLVKRIIGMPNETVSHDGNQLYINNEPVAEDFLGENKIKTGYIEEIILQQDEYFVMGDNREFSYDSRYFGPIKYEKILARGLIIIGSCGRVEKGVCYDITYQFPQVK